MPTRVSAKDFMEWLEPGRSADLIDGQIFVRAPVSIRHANLVNFLDRLLGTYIDRDRLGELFREVVAVRLGSGSVFQPDLAFYRAERRSAFHPNHIEGAPDLVVEVLSPGTASRDSGPKFTAYERHGVIEYWMLNPQTLVHRFYRRVGDELVECAEGSAKVESQVVTGFFVMREWLDPERLPPLTESLATIEGARE